LVKKYLLLKMQQLILGTGTAIWWLTEPHCQGKYGEHFVAILPTNSANGNAALGFQTLFVI
jgi:hypothetical protein